ncbi:MAG TPA: CPBP family intramembrane glutamic endopeptidase [Anaerolineales bacterium]|nr:CPBP family intramembrane glutamic endopeptidase [Anaerolineales bacterium]
MPTLAAIVRRHPVFIYYLLVFAISSGGILLLIGGPAGLPATADEFERLIAVAIPVQLGGPSIAGLLLTGVVGGRAGFRELLARLRRWRVHPGWYAVALFTAPVVFAAVHLILGRVSEAYTPGLLTTPNRAGFLLSGLMSALVVGILEEIGWTGFAIPRLLPRRGLLTTGLIVGILWGGWHLLPHNFWAAQISAGDLPMGIFILINGIGYLVGQLVAFRVLMVWVYEHTGSLLLAMLMHASLTGCTFILGPGALAIAGRPLLIYSYVLAAGFWVMVAVVGLARKGRLEVARPHAAGAS